MEIYEDDTDLTNIHMFQRVVNMFEARPSFQRIVRLGLLANMGYGDVLDDTSEDEYDNWTHGHNSNGYPRLSERHSDRGLGGSHTRSTSSVYPPHYYASAHDLPHPPSVNVQAKESDTERRGRLLQETKKSKGKAEKKRLKKQKQKERKRLEKLEKEKQNPVKHEEGEDDAQQSKAGESNPVNDASENTNSSDKPPSKDTDSSDSSEDESIDEDSDTKNDLDDSEELDMTSTFVSKAALIARRKLEQKSSPEKKKEKKTTPVKEEPKTNPEKSKEDLEAEKKDCAASNSPSFEDNIKISTELANTGNRFASSGDFYMAVKFFTDAIKYNPTEFKLFGNRSFCFEKMQDYEKALTDAELSLSICPGWVKGLFRKSRALAGLKRYEEASQAFREVLKLDSTCAEAAQELMRVQITQLMGYGFTRKQSSNALIIHGTVQKALEVLSKLNHQGALQNDPLPPPQVANVTGVSPVLSVANPAPHPPQSQHAPKTPLKNKPLGPVQNMSTVMSQPKPAPDQAAKTNNEDRHPPQGLFPIWVGNLVHTVTESVITNLFNKVGNVHSVKVLSQRRCAFVNFTKQECCDEAIRRFHGYALNGIHIAVKYPDRIPHGMGISRSALKADDLQDENARQNEYSDRRNGAGGRRPVGPYRHAPDYRGNYKY